MRKLLVIAMMVAACGDDDDAGGTRPNGAAPPPPPPGAKKPGNNLQPRDHVEDKISCPVPDAPTGHAACTPVDLATDPATTKLLLDCDPGSYCMQIGNTHTCEPCAERESIRHDFKDRDFVDDQNRDPFQSFVILQAGLGPGSNTAKPEPHQSCKRADQFVATGYSYQDLRLVGIISEGTARKAVMMDTANFGHGIKRGDCVGKEKAVVKDIGAGYITFVVEEDPDSKHPAVETSFQLHPGGLDEGPPTSQPSPASVTPIVPPPVAPPTGR
jgi:Tfp pilus assembly protein PilP